MSALLEMKVTDFEGRLRDVRAQLVRELKSVQPASVMAFQQHLADALLTDVPAAESIRKRHVHLLRAIGDALAWSTIPEHTIRTLNRHPGPSPSLKGQRAGLAFTMRVADALSETGLTVVVNDLTHLLRVGDLVAVRETGVAIIECKDTRMPPTLPQSGRLARQRERGEHASDYLRKSSITEPSGVIRLAVARPPTLTPNWEAVQRAVVEADSNANGVGVVALDSRDYVIAMSGKRFSIKASPNSKLLPSTDGWGKPVIAFDTEWKLDPLPFIPSPLGASIPTDNAVDLLEGQLLIGRAIDATLIECERTLAGRVVRLKVDADRMGATAILDEDLQIHLPTLLPMILYTGTPLQLARESMLAVIEGALIDYANWPADNRQTPTGNWLAAGDDTIYGTAYRGEDDQIQVVMRAEAAEEIGLL